MGLEFKPYFWEDDEEHDRHVKQCEKQTTANSEQSDISEDSSVSGGHGEEDEPSQPSQQQQQLQPRGGLVFVHADGTPPAAPVAPALGSRELAPALAAVNTERREYAALVASEEDDVSEYKSFFCIVLDHPQFLGQGETKESALRQARMYFHYSLGSMLLKNESIPAPSSGAELEVQFQNRSSCQTLAALHFLVKPYRKAILSFTDSASSLIDQCNAMLLRGAGFGIAQH